MLTALAIRDIVIFDTLDLDLSRGLTVLTGETGAGKSILLDSMTLALGGRGDGGLVRSGATQGQVTAVFDIAADHPARLMAQEMGLDAVLRNGVAVALFGDIDALGRGADIIEHAVVDQAVMDNDIGLAERLDGFDRQQAGIARPRTDEDNAPTRFRIEKTGHCCEMAVGVARGKRN